MAVFEYIARTTAGEKVTGVLEAVSEGAALNVLGDKRLFPISVAVQDEAKTRGRNRKLRARDMAGLFEQLADLIGVDLSCWGIG